MFMRKILFITCLISTLCVKAQVSPLCFNGSPYSGSPITSNNSSITSGDFNGDGIEDLVSANASGLSNISVFFGTGNATFLAAVNYTTGFSPRLIKSSDFNGDGTLDLIFCTGNTSNSIINILYGTSVGTFSTTTQYTITSNTTCFEVGDFNSDGKPDLVTSNSLDTKLKILLNDGLGGFLAPIDYILNYRAVLITINDFNGDGNKDIALIDNGWDNLTVLYGTSTGTFSQPSTSNPFNLSTLSPHSITSGDFNNDGKKDIAISAETSMGAFSLNVLISNNSNGFNPLISIPISKVISYIKATDLNADNNLDIIGFTGAASINNVNEVTMLFGTGTGSLTLGNSYYTGGALDNIEAKDFNNDGKMDLARNNNGYISILIGTGLGNFISYNFSLEFSSSNFYKSMASADFNNDGFNDLAVTNTNLTEISVLIGQGDGQFAPLVTYSVGLYPYCIATGDFNGDSNVDLAVANESSDDVSVLLGTSTGSFLPAVNYTVGITPRAITVSDFNGDGYSDFACVSFTSKNLFIRFGNQSGTLSTGPAYSLLGYQPVSINSSDFNGDGKIDLAVTNNNNVILIFINNSSGGFLAPVSYSTGITGGGLGYVLPGDFNGDSKIDLAVANVNANCISLFQGTGSGTFLAPINYSVGVGPLAMVKDDYNNDGTSDLLISQGSSTFFSILMSTPSGSFSPAITYPIGQTQDVICSTDLNGDGKKDIVIKNRVFINSIPTFTLSSPNSICLGDSVIISASNTGISNYNWSTGANTSSITVAPTTTTNYSVTGSTIGGCMNTAVKTISVSAVSPTVTIMGSNSLCSGTSSIFVASGATTYTWNTGQTTPSITVTSYSNTIYTVVGTDVYGCSDTAINPVTVEALPVFSLSVPSGTITCMNPVVGFTVATTDNFLWTGPGIISPSLTAPNVTVNTPGIYSVVVTGTNSCLNTGTMVVVSDTIGPVVNIISTATVICEGASSSITVNAIPANSVSYLWSNLAITQSITVNPSQTTLYTVTVTDNTNGCSTTNTVTMNVNALPMLSITGSNLLCLGSSSSLVVSGATAYIWNTGATTSSINVMPTTTTTYSVVGTDVNGCVNTETISVTVDNTCADVWPGDANSDGTADNLDVLELGLHYTQTGAARASASNNWQSYFANNWIGTITNGKNLNHSDCNGDGIINDNDTLAIFNNYGLTHVFKPTQTNTVNPQLSIVPDQSMVVKGTWGTASVYLGDATSQINNINGVAFTVDFDNTLIEPNNIWIEYQNSFIDAGQNLHFQKPDFANNKLFTASTHTVSNNVSGFGKIATLHYQIKSSLATDEVLNIALSQANQSNASGAIASLTSGTGTLMAIGASVGVKESLMPSGMLVSPNPTNGLLNISFNTIPQNTKIELYNSIGALVLTEQINNKTNTINLSDLSSGIYFMKVLEGNKVVAVKKVVRE